MMLFIFIRFNNYFVKRYSHCFHENNFFFLKNMNPIYEFPEIIDEQKIVKSASKITRYSDERRGKATIAMWTSGNSDVNWRKERDFMLNYPIRLTEYVSLCRLNTKECSSPHSASAFAHCTDKHAAHIHLHAHIHRKWIMLPVFCVCAIFFIVDAMQNSKNVYAARIFRVLSVQNKSDENLCCSWERGWDG